MKEKIYLINDPRNTLDLRGVVNVSRHSPIQEKIKFFYRLAKISLKRTVGKWFK